MDSAAMIIDHWSRKQIHNPTGVSIRVAGAVWKAEWMYQHLHQLLEQGISQGLARSLRSRTNLVSAPSSTLGARYITRVSQKFALKDQFGNYFFKYIGKLVIVIDFNLIVQNVQILKVKNSKLRMCCFNVTII